MGNTIEFELKSSAGTQLVSLATHLYNRHNCIFIQDEITNKMAASFEQQILLLLSNAGNEPIRIILNSPGGSVQAGMVIYDLIQGALQIREIEIYCTGMAASMAAVLLAGGQKGERYILKHSKTMIHEPSISSLGGTATSIQNISENIIETRRMMNELLARHCGKNIVEIDEATNHGDNYMNAEESIAFGLCDEVIMDIGKIIGGVSGNNNKK